MRVCAALRVCADAARSHVCVSGCVSVRRGALGVCSGLRAHARARAHALLDCGGWTLPQRDYAGERERERQRERERERVYERVCIVSLGPCHMYILSIYVCVCVCTYIY